MEFRSVPPDLRQLDETSTELIACSMWKDERPMRGLAGLLDWRLAGRISKLARESFIEGELGEVLFVPGARAFRSARSSCSASGRGAPSTTARFAGAARPCSAPSE